MKKVELLAPGGDVRTIKSALLAGADAIFCGVGNFNARRRANNLTIEDLEELIPLTHSYGSKIYLTLNTTLLESELQEALDVVKRVNDIGIDAIIVQDYGLLSLIREKFPNLEIHASTQMTTHNSGQLDLLKSFGVKQVNFSRELNIGEIKGLTKSAHNLDLAVEVFVHGAFCVSFSGQCYMSNTLTNEAGNRGSCVQTCRRGYSVEGRGKEQILPFNLKDNSLYNSADKLLEAGVDSLKIEGRIKGEEYVYTTTSTWREQIDSLENEQKLLNKGEDLTKVFNRSLTDGYAKGELSRDMFTDNGKDDSIKPLSTIRGYHADRKELTLFHGYKLIKGQEIQIFDDNREFIVTAVVDICFSTNLYKVKLTNKLRGKIRGGMKIWGSEILNRTDNLDDKIKAIKPVTSEIRAEVTAKLSNKLEVTMSYENLKVTLFSTSTLEEASARALTLETIKDKLGKLGGTDYSLGDITAKEFDENLFLPIKELNQMKREAVAFFDVNLHSQESENIEYNSPTPLSLSSEKGIVALIGSVDDLELIKEFPNVNFCYEIPTYLSKQEEKLLEIFKEYKNLIPWFPAILIGNEYKTAKKFIDKITPKMIVTENSGIANYAQKIGVDWVAGSLLNSINSKSVDVMKSGGAIGIIHSTELRREQLKPIICDDKMEYWYPIISHKFLMSSRQCLVRNVIDCDKKVVDEDCMLNCGKSGVIRDNHDRKLLVTKREGFYNQIFDGTYFYNPEIVSNTNLYTNLLIDLRAILNQRSLAENREIINSVELLLESDFQAERNIKSILESSDNETYLNGLL